MTRWGNKKAPDVIQEPSSTVVEMQARTAAGWTLRVGYPVIFNENYDIGKFTYYAGYLTTPSGQVWRIPTNQL